MSRRRPPPTAGSYYKNFRGVARPIARKRVERQLAWVDVTCDNCARRVGALSVERAPATEDNLIIEGQSFAREYVITAVGLSTACARCGCEAVLSADGAVVALNGLIDHGRHAVSLSVAQLRTLGAPPL